MSLGVKLEFRHMDVEAIERLSPYFGLRPNKTCDSVFLDNYLWKNYYQVRYAVCDEKAVLWLIQDEEGLGSAMPSCRQEDLEYYFQMLVEYFNEELKLPLRIHLADEEAVEYLGLRRKTKQFRVTEQEDFKDYLYDGERLRTLSGKKLRKKKNHLNYFLREYEGRYEYQRIVCQDRGDVWRFLYRWREARGEETEKHLDYEVQGIHDILKNCSSFRVHMGGVYVDGRLEAFTLGSYNEYEDMAVIHIEKANPEIRGLYQFINQQFLLHEFPTVRLVNREDDLGLEGLRKAKMSYDPVGFARNYSVEQKIDCGNQEEIMDDTIFGEWGEM